MHTDLQNFLHVVSFRPKCDKFPSECSIQVVVYSAAQWWIFYLVNSLILYNYIHVKYCNIQRIWWFFNTVSGHADFSFLIFNIAAKNIIFSKSKNILGLHVQLCTYLSECFQAGSGLVHASTPVTPVGQSVCISCGN